jgi:hypothetical protein
LTGDQKHTDYIATAQHLNRHADQSYVFLFFPHLTKKIEILPTHKNQACKSANSFTRHITTMTVLKVKNRILADKRLN